LDIRPNRTFSHILSSSKFGAHSTSFLHPRMALVQRYGAFMGIAPLGERHQSWAFWVNAALRARPRRTVGGAT